MAISNWMRADALMSILLDRGYGSEHAYEVVERVSFLTHDAGVPELQAIEQTLGYCPHTIRAQLETADVQEARK